MFFVSLGNKLPSYFSIGVILISYKAKVPAQYWIERGLTIKITQYELRSANLEFKILYILE